MLESSTDKSTAIFRVPSSVDGVHADCDTAVNFGGVTMAGASDNDAPLPDDDARGNISNTLQLNTFRCAL